MRTRWNRYALIASAVALGAAVTLAVLLAPGCDDDPEGVLGAELLGSGLEALDPVGEAEPAVEPVVAPAGIVEPADDLAVDPPTADPGVEDDREPSGDDASIGLEWSFEPKELMVYRSTAIHFRLVRAPRGHETVSCTWNFGDGSPTVQGCNVSHTFHGGQADQSVSVTLHDGSWEWSSTRSVPLERLPVVELVEAAASSSGAAIKPGPTASETDFRFAVIADTAADGGVPKSVSDGIRQLANTKPELVIHTGGIVTATGGPSDWAAADAAIGEPLREAGAKVVWALSPTDLSRTPDLPAPGVLMVDGRDFPRRYSFTYKGSFFCVISSDSERGVTEPTLRWLRTELGKARVYEARYVVSYLPLHKFGDTHVGTLDQKFRLYELFLRGRVTAFISGAYRVYFKGRYGALPVLSVGTLAGPGDRLAGSNYAQPSSFTLVDVVKGVPERIFGVDGPAYDRVLDESTFPDAVEVYTR